MSYSINIGFIPVLIRLYEMLSVNSPIGSRISLGKLTLHLCIMVLQNPRETSYPSFPIQIPRI